MPFEQAERGRRQKRTRAANTNETNERKRERDVGEEAITQPVVARARMVDPGDEQGGRQKRTRAANTNEKNERKRKRDVGEEAITQPVLARARMVEPGDDRTWSVLTDEHEWSSSQSLPLALLGAGVDESKIQRAWSDRLTEEEKAEIMAQPAIGAILPGQRVYQKLAPRKLVNDDCLDCFLRLLCDQWRAYKGECDVHVLSTKFMYLLRRNGVGVIPTRRSRRSLGTVTPLSEYRVVLIPMHSSETHWSLVAFFPQQRRCYDLCSMNGGVDPADKILLLGQLSLSFETVADLSWRSVPVSRQTEVECGARTCLHAMLILAAVQVDDVNWKTLGSRSGVALNLLCRKYVTSSLLKRHALIIRKKTRV